jgi:uncharacterized membrane protein
MGSAARRRARTPTISTAPEVGLVVAAALAPGTFAPSLSPRSAVDQGIVTGLATGLHYLLAAGAQDALVAPGFGESLGAHTSQDVFLHWGTLGLDAMGIDRALWIGTPYGSKWMHQVTRGDRLDVDRAAVAVVNDHAQLTALTARRGNSPRFVLLSHDNDGVTKFGLDLLWSPPDWLDRHRPRTEPVDDGGSPRGIPPAMRWRPVTTFFQSLIDMKNAQEPGSYRAWAHDYRSDLPGFLSDVYGVPATPAQLARIEEALQVRETVRERLFEGASDDTPSNTHPVNLPAAGLPPTRSP